MLITKARNTKTRSNSETDWAWLVLSFVRVFVILRCIGKCESACPSRGAETVRLLIYLDARTGGLDLRLPNEIAKADKFREPVTCIAADQELAGHDQPERFRVIHEMAHQRRETDEQADAGGACQSANQRLKGGPSAFLGLLRPESLDHAREDNHGKKGHVAGGGDIAIVGGEDEADE